jgi:BirA family biotin operon repressor/biotin-[acetyl-CoA-carboxylase] ligase
MTTQQQVLQILETHRGISVSGEHIAQHLQVSRAAVWRAIRDLRRRGYDITASTKVGYCLASSSDFLSKEGINSVLSQSLPVEIHYYDYIDSTNREAKRLATEGAAHGTVVVAGKQTAGRGRMGRSFYSPGDSGLYLSIIIRRDLASTLALRITSAVAVGVCQAIERFSDRKAVIKWVNDIYMDGKKVCGILTEGISGFESGKIESMVVGIGVNCTLPPDGFPDDIASIASAIFPHEVPSGFSRNHLCAAIIEEVLAIIEKIDAPEVIQACRDRSIVLHKRVQIIQGSSSREGEVIEIADDGSLLIRTDDNAVEKLNSGEISLRPVFLHTRG